MFCFFSPFGYLCRCFTLKSKTKAEFPGCLWKWDAARLRPSPFYSADRLLGVGLRPAAVEGVKLWWLNKGWLTIYSARWKKNICGEKAPSSPRKLFVSDSLMRFKNTEWGGTPESHPLSHVCIVRRTTPSEWSRRLFLYSEPIWNSLHFKTKEF